MGGDQYLPSLVRIFQNVDRQVRLNTLSQFRINELYMYKTPHSTALETEFSLNLSLSFYITEKRPHSDPTIVH